MNYCAKCGFTLSAGEKFCPCCGKSIVEKSSFEMHQATHETEKVNLGSDNAKIMSILAYIMFFIPLLVGEHKKSEFVRFHVNQATVLFISIIAWSFLSIISTIFLIFLPILGAVMSPIFGLGGLLLTVMSITGIVYAATDKMKPLPVIGKITIIR